MRIAAPLILAILLGCGGQPSSKEGYASTKIFYFEVKCISSGPNCDEVKQFLESEIPRYKYTFSPGSSRTWPYYKAFALDADVPLDSLISPHTQLHQLVPYKDRPLFGGEEYLVVIDLFSVSDTKPDYNVNVFRLESSGPVLSGTSGLQDVENRPGQTLTVPELVLRSAIRYSFK